MTPAIQAAITELQAALIVTEQDSLGFGNLKRLPLSDAALGEITKTLSVYQELVMILQQAIANLLRLEELGYPTLPGANVAEGILAEIDKHSDAIDAARKLIRHEAATGKITGKEKVK
jgi:hypothetical protein